jgi:hypothetical protein
MWTEPSMGPIHCAGTNEAWMVFHFTVFVWEVLEQVFLPCNPLQPFLHPSCPNKRVNKKFRETKFRKKIREILYANCEIFLVVRNFVKCQFREILNFQISYPPTLCHFPIGKKLPQSNWPIYMVTIFYNG